jgi:hypothetical protein
MKRALVVSSGLLISLALGGCGRTPNSGTNAGPAAATPPAGIPSSADVVKVTASPVTVARDSSAEAVVALSISPGFHINANPATFSYLIPTEVTAGKIDVITTGKPVYPTAEKKKFQFAAVPLAVYEGAARIKLPLRAEKNAAKGAHSLPINVRVQACDHEQCFPPATLNATISVEVK